MYQKISCICRKGGTAVEELPVAADVVTENRRRKPEHLREKLGTPAERR
jgi:hypothetical protein